MEKKRILVIDDESSFTRLVKLNLEKTGEYEVREENRGHQAFEAVRQFSPDLILLDVIMPDVDGGTVAAQIRADERLRDVPILLLTAVLSRQESQTLGGMINGYPCLTKPVATTELVGAIDRFLAERKTKI